MEGNNFENKSENELFAEWKKLIETGVDATLESYESLLEMGMLPNFSPASFTGLELWPGFMSPVGLDERTFAQLNQKEKDFITTILFNRIGFDPTKARRVEQYTYKDPGTGNYTAQEHVLVRQFKTGIKRIYLHELSKHGQVEDYIIAPREYRLDE